MTQTTTASSPAPLSGATQHAALNACLQAPRNADSAMWLDIDGVRYDITHFAKRHPGGNVLLYYNGMDASDAFHAFHPGNPRAATLLRSLPTLPIDNKPVDPLVQDFRALRTEFRKEGIFNPPVFTQLVRFGELMALYALGAWLFHIGSPVLAVLVLGLAFGRNGLFMHEAGHRAMTGHVLWDKYICTLLMTMGSGGSADYWVNQHSKHHAKTQVQEQDIDLRTLPLFAFDKETYKHHHFKGALDWLKLQYLYFVPLTSLVMESWVYLTHPRHIFRTRLPREVVCIVLHYVLWYLMCMQYGLVGTLVYHTLTVAVGSCYLTTVFALNHTHKPTRSAASVLDWVRASAHHTTNIAPSWFNNWLTGYLNYQIEHHMFPAIPHPNLQLISGRIRALCAKHGVEYDCRSLGGAFKALHANLYAVPRD